MSSWSWIPNEGLGPVKFECDINVYIKKLGALLDLSDEPDSTNWVQYHLPDREVFIDVESNKVVSILCYDEFLYKGNNLIGMRVADVDKLIECSPDEIGEPVIYDDGDVQTPYEYMSLGLQIWFSNNQAVSISCSKYELE